MPALRTDPRLSRPEDFDFNFIEVGLGRQETLSKITVRTSPRPVPPLPTPFPIRLASPSRVKPRRAGQSDAETRRAAIRRDETSDPPRLDPTSKNLVVQIFRLVPSDSADQTAGSTRSGWLSQPSQCRESTFSGHTKSRRWKSRLGESHHTLTSRQPDSVAFTLPQTPPCASLRRGSEGRRERALYTI
jgi:hypothetical protein